VALLEWEAEDFPCVRHAEIDAVAHRIIRMAELLKRMREIAGEIAQHSLVSWPTFPHLSTVFRLVFAYLGVPCL